MTRRHWLAAAAAPLARAKSPSFFTIAKSNGRWWFRTPESKPFFSAALNHIDSSTLRYPENIAIWDSKYGNSQLRWIRESVAPNLRKWGFNSVGWVQEVSIRRRAHTPPFSPEEYQALGLPYFHLLPFIETHQWNPWHKNPDLRSQDFRDWCDYVARDACSRLKNDPKLIGYFYSDCPTWVHSNPHTKWRGPMFDPEALKSPAGRAELSSLATHYYTVIRDSIRRYDPHHLLLGDRYEANQPLPLEVVNAARPLVDALSFQDFKDPVGQMRDWHQRTSMPVLWADGSRAINVPDSSGRYEGNVYKRLDGAWYATVLRGLRDNPGAIGAHLCGAYLRNRFRAKGLLDEQERPDEQALAPIAAANRELALWLNNSR
jgi:hypothetical protein